MSTTSCPPKIIAVKPPAPKSILFNRLCFGLTSSSLFFTLSFEERAEVIKAYKNTIKNKTKTIASARDNWLSPKLSHLSADRISKVIVASIEKGYSFLR